MEKKQKKQHARSRSFTGSGLASFFRSTFSSTVPSTGGGGRWSSFNHRNAFSGPIAVSIVPPEARGRSGGGRRSNKRSSGYATPEPSSPKVSCIGQIKRSNSRRQKKVNPSASSCPGGACPLPPRPAEGKKPSRLPSKKGGSLLKRVSFFRRSRSRSLSRASSSTSKDGLVGDGKAMAAAAAGPAPAAPPAGLGLGQMRRFTSGRAAFQDFDWREEERRSRGSDEEDDYDDGFVAHSAPLVLGGGVVASEPRKEVNLWRRRPMAPPTPLELP